MERGAIGWIYMAGNNQNVCKSRGALYLCVNSSCITCKVIFVTRPRVPNYGRLKVIVIKFVACERQGTEDERRKMTCGAKIYELFFKGIRKIEID